MTSKQTYCVVDSEYWPDDEDRQRKAKWVICLPQYTAVAVSSTEEIVDSLNAAHLAGRADAFRDCIEILESRKRYWDGGDLARVGEYSNFVKELDHLIQQMESVRDGKDGRP